MELIKLLAECPDVRFDADAVLEFFSYYERFKRDILHSKGALRVPAKYPRYRKGEHPSLETMLRISEFFDIPLVLILQEPGIATKLLSAMSPTILMMGKNNLERGDSYGERSIREMERATFGGKLWEYNEEIRKGNQLSFGAFLRSYGVSKGFANYHFPELCRDVARQRRYTAALRKWSTVEAIHRAFFEDGLLRAYRAGTISSQDLLVSTVVRLTGASTSLVRRVFREICQGRTQLEQIRNGVYMTIKDLSGALRTAINILDAWDISGKDRLAMLGCSQECYERWVGTRQLGDPPPETLERLSYILGIWKALKTLFPESAVADTWIQRPNYDSLFGGQPPLTLMVTGRIEDLSRVRQFLDGWCD